MAGSASRHDGATCIFFWGGGGAIKYLLEEKKGTRNDFDIV